MKKKKKIIIGIAILVVLIILGNIIFGKGKHEQKVSFETAKVATASIATSVTATGTIEPVTSVEVGTQVSGIVSKLFVDYNSVVKKGDVIAELDKTNLMAELASAKNNLASAESSYKSSVATLDYQRANFKRYQTLYNKGLVSANDYEQARMSYENAEMSASQAKSQISVAQQNVTKAQTNLGYATITSPIDGIILSKEVEEGQTVAASFNTPTLFTIAQDLTNMQVIATVDEADIGEVKEGKRVTFTVDAYPNDKFEGCVTQVRQEATTTNNVVTYEVVISAPNEDLKLKPGLTASVTIFTQEKSDVLSVPNKALRVVPTVEVLGPVKIIDVPAPKKVWTKEGNVFKAHAVTTGLSDSNNTEILSGILAGTEIITEIKIGNPFMPDGNQQGFSPFGPPRQQQKKK
ncbi:MAG: efflux RND transporter periplasmic adaptor subunit [Prevotellaceae bacterium]|nr:efflux RND transporter periplasmic adaptor subunit [Prevotellaceae bacterium]